MLVASAAVLGLLGVAASRLSVSTDWVEPLLPQSDTELRSYAEALHRFGDTETIYVDVAASDPDTLHTAADLAEERMRAAPIFTRVVGRLSQASLHRTAQAVGDAAPLLLDDSVFAEIDARTTPEALAARMEDHYEQLLSPIGGSYQSILARDPLGLAAMVLERSGTSGTGGGAHIERGRLVSGDGKHALILGVAAARVGDDAGATAITSFFGELEAAVAEVTGSDRVRAQLVWIGGHRYYQANARAMKRDVTWVSLLAMALVLAVIFVGFRGARITWIAATAVVIGSVVGAAALALCFPAVSGIALGFGAALSGISVDYVIHLHAPRRKGETRSAAVRRAFATVGPSVIIGALTSAAGFLLLATSDVPAHGQLGVAAGGGILGALLFALFPGPILAALGKRDEPATVADRPNVFDRSATSIFGWILGRPGSAFAVGAVLVALGAAAIPFLQVEPEIRRFEVRDEKLDGVRSALGQAWGDVFAQELIVTSGPDVQTVLARTDLVVAALRPVAGKEFSGIASTASIMPALTTQRARFEAWTAFWTAERRARVRTDLTAAASQFGIKGSTFEPFFQSLDTAPALLVPERLEGTPLDAIVARHLSVGSGDVLGLIVLSGVPPPGTSAAEGSTWRDRVHQAVPDARFLSGRGLASAIVAATRRSLAVLALPALGLVWLLLAAYYRSPVLACVALFPLIGGLVLTAGILFACGERLNMMNAAVALPVFGLGVDYAVFLIDAMRDAARDAPNDRGARIAAVGERMGTMIGDVLTTVAGSVAMLFAATPAMFSMGLALTAGVVGVMLIAWLMVPQTLVWTRLTPR